MFKRLTLIAFLAASLVVIGALHAAPHGGHGGGRGGHGGGHHGGGAAFRGGGGHHHGGGAAFHGGGGHHHGGNAAFRGGSVAFRGGGHHHGGGFQHGGHHHRSNFGIGLGLIGLGYGLGYGLNYPGYGYSRYGYGSGYNYNYPDYGYTSPSYVYSPNYSNYDSSYSPSYVYSVPSDGNGYPARPRYSYMPYATDSDFLPSKDPSGPPAQMPPAGNQLGDPPAVPNGNDVGLNTDDGGSTSSPSSQTDSVSAPATVRVTVPPGAIVWVGSQRSKQTGTNRLFTSPPLEPGHNYSYEVKVRWKEYGEPVEETRVVHVQAGKESQVDFGSGTESP